MRPSPTLVLVGNVSSAGPPLSALAPPRAASPPLPPPEAAAAATALSVAPVAAPVAPAGASVQLNHRRVLAALSGVLFAGAAYATRLAAARAALEEHTGSHVVIGLLTTTSGLAGQFAGLYVSLDDAESGRAAASAAAVAGGPAPPLQLARRIYGGARSGPSVLLVADVQSTFKYDGAAKAFVEVSWGRREAIALSIDAVGISASWTL
jgi:hypothetical protein